MPLPASPDRLGFVIDAVVSQFALTQATSHSAGLFYAPPF